MTRLVIVGDNLNSRQLNRITRLIKATKVAWWHRLQFCWLVRDSSERDAKWWRNRLKGVVSPGTILVIEIKGAASWAAMGPPGTFEWLKNSWRAE
jgi:hypothetical protein